MFVYYTQLEIALKVALRYSLVEELEVTILKGIFNCLLRFKHQIETMVPNKSIERRGGRRFLSNIVPCANTSIIEGVVDQGIDTLRRYWLGSVFLIPNTRSPKRSFQVNIAVVALQSVYVQIGFSAEAALVITYAQSIYCMEELEILTDGETENMCKVIRRPSGINPITNVDNLG